MYSQSVIFEKIGFKKKNEDENLNWTRLLILVLAQ